MEIVDPKSLQEAVIAFSDPAKCLAYLVPRRWANEVVLCPTCGSSKVTYQEKRLRWQCSTHHPKRQFSVKAGTIFEESPLGLDKWLPAVWLLTNCKNGVSSWELSRAIDVTQKTAWFMLHRIRMAHQGKTGGKLGGPMGEPVEVDETYIGGKARNMHADKKARVMQGRKGGSAHRTVVLGVLERHGEVRTKVIGNTTNPVIREHVKENVEFGSRIHSDEGGDNWRMDQHFIHEMVNHSAEEYVRGNVHTNGIENFWSLLKRGIGGTYVSVEPFHLFRYVDEQAFRYNNRKGMDDADRFDQAIRQIVGKRLTYAELTGKLGETRAEAF